MYKNILLGINISLVSTMLWATAALAQNDQVVGNVSRLQGNVVVVRATQKSTVGLGDDVLRSDELLTRNNSLVEVQFTDGSSFLLDENAAVTIAQYAPGDAPRSLLELTRGRLRSQVSSAFSDREDSYQVKTREGVMGVQGTEFEVIARLRETSVYVYTGLVSATSEDPDYPGSVLLRPGDFLSIRLGEPLRPPNRFFGLSEADNDADTIIGSGGDQALISGGLQSNDPTAPAPTSSDQFIAGFDITPPPPRPPAKRQ